MNRDTPNIVETSSNDQRRLVSTAFGQFERLTARTRIAPADALRSLSIPGYRILSEIHRGGQGVVYQAIQESTQRKVAIKVLKEGPFADRIELARFELEVDVLSRLKHPHIVAVHDRGLVAGHAYLVMDFVAGKPLDAYVAGAGLSVAELLGLLIKVCHAINVAHLRGVIHRDLKPGNIRIDELGEPRILDFGLAKLVQEVGQTSSAEGMTLTGQFVGSLPWASPEQAAGRSERIDVRTDVYSLGVILYQLLTGRFPYPVSGRIDDVVRHIAQTSPARPSSIRRGIERDLELILLTCLAKEPERRYQTAGEMARDILHYLADEPVLAVPPTTGYRLRKFVRRNRGLVLAGATVTAALVLGVVGTTIGLVWAVREQRRTEQQKIIAENSATTARDEAERADREADQARAITEFMREVLTSVEPENRGADVRLIEVLANAAAAASQRFAGHPLQEAHVRELLGQIYSRLSLWPEAKVEHGKALALWQKHIGPDDPRALSAESTLAGLAINAWQLQEAEQMLAELAPRLERLLGPDDLLTLDARRKVAVVHYNRGREDEAERMLLELRAHPRLADNDEMQIRILNNLINLSLRRRLSAEDPAQQLTILGQVSQLAHEQVERSMRRYGPESMVTLRAQVWISEILCKQGRYTAAADACRAILAWGAGRSGECHEMRAEAMHTLAEALHVLGEEREPAELHLRRIECLRRALPADSPAFLGALSVALRYLERAGRAAEGETLARELAVTLLKYGGGHDSMAFTSELYVARFVSMQGRMDEAEPMFQQLLSREKLQDSRTRARLRLFYGSQLMRRGLFPDAEQQLLAAVACIEDIRAGTWDTHPDDIILGFIALYEAWGKRDSVDEFQRLREEVTGRPAEGAGK